MKKKNTKSMPVIEEVDSTINEKRISLNGVIEQGMLFDNYHTIKLVQDDGYKIDLICRFEEFSNSFNRKVSVTIWITDKKTTLEEAQVGFLKTMDGAIDATVEKNEYQLSEYTGGIDYNSELNIGGHSLYNELMEKVGKYMWIEIMAKI